GASRWWGGRASGDMPRGRGTRRRRRDAVKVGIAALQVPPPRRVEARPCVQDPRVVEDDAVARVEPEGQHQLRPHDHFSEGPVGRVERDHIFPPCPPCPPCPLSPPLAPCPPHARRL